MQSSFTNMSSGRRSGQIKSSSNSPAANSKRKRNAPQCDCSAVAKDTIDPTPRSSRAGNRTTPRCPPHPLREPRAAGRIDCAGTPLAQRDHDRPHRQRCEHRRARGLQRPAGQHDDLARLPRTRARQGRNRRAPPARPWRDANARFARGVASPKTDARYLDWQSRFQNPRLNVPMLHRGTGIRGPETARPKSPLWAKRSLRRPKRQRQSPPIAGYLSVSEKFPSSKECVVGPGDIWAPTTFNHIQWQTGVSAAIEAK